MKKLAGIPYVEVEFNRHGRVEDPARAGDAVQAIAGGDATDLFVISHGWNNDMQEARALYGRFFERVSDVLRSGRVPAASGRRFAILGVLWPSKRFADRELIPSGAARLASPFGDDEIERQVHELRGVFDAPAADAALEEAGRLVSRLEESPAARRRFADLVRGLLPRSEDEEEREVPASFFQLDGEALMERLGTPDPLPAAERGGAAAATGAPAGESRGEGAGLRQRFAGPKAAARNLLNYVTYYEMKNRAGLVGRRGLNPLLRELRARDPDLKIHLVGHSFGGRLVSAAADEPAELPAVNPVTLTLLQAAFSHHGFARRYDGEHDGFFRRVVADRKVAGPILVTHSRNDTAVGLAYPIASRIMGQVAAAVGDRNDPFGGIGRNGAQKTPEAIDGRLLKLGEPYTFEPGKLYNLRADDWISDHSDICKNEIAYAVLAAVGST